MPSLSAKNLGFIFDSTLSLSKQISSSACQYFPILKFLHWLKGFNIRSSILHNLLHITELTYLHRLINIKPPSRTHSSDHLCLSLSPVSTRLKFADRSFRNSSSLLWNSLTINLRSFAPDTHHSTTVTSSTPSHPCRALSLSRNQFLWCLKTTSLLFLTLHNFSALPSFPAPFSTGQF